MAIPYNRFSTEIKGRAATVDVDPETGTLSYQLEYEVTVDGVKQIRTTRATKTTAETKTPLSMVQEMADKVDDDTGIAQPTS